MLFLRMGEWQPESFCMDQAGPSRPAVFRLKVGSPGEWLLLLFLKSIAGRNHHRNTQALLCAPLVGLLEGEAIALKRGDVTHNDVVDRMGCLHENDQKEEGERGFHLGGTG